MANTEGLSDEAMSSLLAMPSSEEEKLQRQHKNVAAVPVGRMKPPSFRCSLARREQMMELGEGVAPAAKVIRSSKAPKVNSASSKKKNYGQACAVEIDDPEQISFEEASIDEHRKIGDTTNPRPAIMYLTEHT